MNLSEVQSITKYEVTLRLLTHEKIEMVRRWRTDPKISQFMGYRDDITPEMQEQWFAELNNGVDNFYWIIEFNGEEIGLINVKDVDYNKKTGESGVFIYSDKYLNTDVSYRAHLAMFDFIFEEVGLQIIYSHMLKTNLRAQRFGLFLGAHLADGQENVENQLYIKTREDYYNNTNRKRFVDRYNKMIARKNECNNNRS